jgi:C1A family cysteine protease
VAVSAISESEYQSKFVQWIDTFDKQYAADTFFSRYNTFKGWVDFVELHNAANHTWKAGLNQFSDLTPDEFKAQYLNGLATSITDLETLPESETPAVAAGDIDWRSKGAVNKIKNQGQCGSCWAFSATENLESVNFLATKKLPIAAPQQIVDCDKAWYGCSGGWPYGAFTYLKNFGGQDSEASYPYKAVDGTCVANTANIVAKLTGYKDVGKDEGSVFAAIATAPLSICVDASRWYLYQSGVISASQCGQSIDHCVQLIGYDQDTAGGGAWLVRNSWGTSWGENGLLRLQMGQDTCAMNDAVTTATL